MRSSGAPKVAVIGEPLIELSGSLFGTMRQSYGGDSINCSVYLSRIMRKAAQIGYVSVVGMDELSEGMIARWQEAGIDTEFVLRDATRIPGLYVIQTASDGERRFLYWREASAARYLMRHPRFAAVAAHLEEMDLVFLTGISLAVLPADDRASLIALLHRLARGGTAIVFDTNYRAELWVDRNEARDALRALMPAVRVALTSMEDERLLWDVHDPDSTFARLREAGVQNVILKMGSRGVMFTEGSTVGLVSSVPVRCPIDTTAAGDSFDAAYVAGILIGLPVHECCSMGNALAATVVAHRGAIVPFDTIPSLEDLRKLAGRATDLQSSDPGDPWGGST